MTSTDLPGFHEAFRSLQRVFPLRGSETDLDRLVADYFRSLRRFALGDVKAAADHWLAHGTKFPKPAEWIAAVPRRPVAEDARQMSRDEAQEQRRAELVGYEDQPCLCSECVRAGVDEKPLRFVPEFDGDDREVKAFSPLSQRLVTVGHWAHGEELMRWYDSRATFYSKFIEWTGARPDLGQVGQERLRSAVQKAKQKARLEEALSAPRPEDR